MKYRKRPVRVPKSKPYTIADENTASLVTWLQTYPMMRSNPKAWFHNHKFNQAELKATAKAGFADVALALGYQYRQPLQVESRPMVISIIANKPHISEAILNESEAA